MRAAIFTQIEEERRRQDGEWGQQHDDKHTTHDWIAILSKHIGRAVVYPWDRAAAAAYRQQMVRVAAVAVAAIEWVDRQLDEEG